MQIIKCPQRCSYWFQIRSKKLTASKAQAIAANGAGLESYVKEMMEIYYGIKERESFSNEHTERGIELEPIIKWEYSLKTGLNCCYPGFCVIDDYTGFSPDFLSIAPLAGAEFKSPIAKYHEQYINRKIPAAYDWQMQFSMWGMRLDEWAFVSYNPEFLDEEMVIIPVKRNNKKIEKLKSGIKTGIELIKIYDEEFSKKNIITV